MEETQRRHLKNEIKGMSKSEYEVMKVYYLDYVERLHAEIDRFIAENGSLSVDNDTLRLEVNTVQAEIARLKKFAREIIKDYCWDLGDPDGGDIQDLAEQLGLIVPHIATADEVDSERDRFEEGDKIFVFAEWLKENTK